MKKSTRLLIAVLFVLSVCQANAQQLVSVPQGINYQSVARSSTGTILTNQRISLRVSIHDSTTTGAIVYSEGHTVTTNAFGTFGVVIGGGSIISGNFGQINWGNAAKNLQIEMDYAGGTNYTNMGTAPLMSVPYALYAAASTGDLQSVKYDTTGVLNATTVAGTTLSAVKSVWLAGGNSGLTNINNYIGTTDNTDFIVKRGGKEAIRFTQGGALLATGDPATGITPASGAGKRMEWIPAKSAFRAGSVSGTQWDDANIGTSSAAFGNDNIASGANSFASGNNSKAIAPNSSAQGDNVIAKATGGTVVGAYNDTTSTSGVNSSDVLFQVGNGTASARANALTVTKSGQVLMQNLVLQDSSVGTPLLPILAGAQVLNPQNNAFVQVYAGGLLSSTTFQLTPGTYKGQTLTMECLVPINLLGLQFGITLTDHRYSQAPSTNNNLRLSTNQPGPQYQYQMKDRDMISLLWDGAYWVETGRSVNN